MNKYFFLILLIIVCGCMGSQFKAPTARINAMQKFVVIPLECPPLTIPGSAVKDWSPEWAGQVRLSQSLSMIPGGTTKAIGTTGMLVGGIFAVIESYKPPTEIKPTISSSDVSKDNRSHVNAWLPTVFLAQEVGRQLSNHESIIDIFVTSKPYEVPGVVFKGETYLMENWLQPLRQWWNFKSGLFNYKEFEEEGVSGIIEVGILNYEIPPFPKGLSMQVIVKLIDLETGSVLGRARDHVFVKIENVDNLFANNGKLFKELFYANGRKLVTSNLKDIGLLDK